jgi:hypothetical protein
MRHPFLVNLFACFQTEVSTAHGSGKEWTWLAWVQVGHKNKLRVQKEKKNGSNSTDDTW